MIQILANDGMEDSAAAKLSAMGFRVDTQSYDAETLLSKVSEYDVLVVRSATKVRKPVIDAAKETGRLKLIIRGGIGVDNIDVDYAKEKGIDVRNTPTASAASVAELAIGHMFSLARFIYAANVTMREGKWEKKKYQGTELAGKTLGVVGMGRIGKHTARIASALGMDVIYVNRSGHKPENEPFAHVSLDELLARADFISLHMPKTDEPILTAEAIAKMKPGVKIVNTARAALIDKQALLDGLERGIVSAAALDVFEEEPVSDEAIYTHPRISMTPHIGASTAEAQKRIGENIVQIIAEMFGKGEAV
ncbi:MAG: D-2-hydroxyacid dehydrogenase [Clostridiales Family XIII bacterium]|nr:D-2-hydroxyacid dehydrogenase [Clostridiales Family XIII bacterium]